MHIIVHVDVYERKLFGCSGLYVVGNRCILQYSLNSFNFDTSMPKVCFLCNELHILYAPVTKTLCLYMT